MAHELKKLLPRHFRIMELLLDGLSFKDTAETVGMSPAAIQMIARSPLFQEELARRRRDTQQSLDQTRSQAQIDAQAVLNDNARRAAETHAELLDDDDPSIRQRSAESILDRVFGKGESKPSAVVQVNAETFQLLKIALDEEDKIIDLEPSTEKAEREEWE